MSLELTRPTAAPLTRREQRQLGGHLKQAQVPAQVAAAKIEAAAFATHVALSHAGMLSATETRLLQLAPLGEARYRAIADAFAGYACQEISLLACR
jgi:hypothetical protein